MPYTIIRGTRLDVEDVLNGAYKLGPFTLAGLPVGGKTLIFSQPAAVTVTFSGAVGDIRTLDEIRNEINTQFVSQDPALLRASDPNNQLAPQSYVAGSGVQYRGKKYVILQDGTNGIEITGGTARGDFGIPTSATVTFVPVAQAKIVGFGPDNTPGQYLALIAP